MIVTLTDVIARARGLGPENRLAQWQKCGQHNLSELPETEAEAGERDERTGGKSGRLVYCPLCFVVWREDGTIFNEPPSL